MERGLVPPCLELGDSLEHALLTQLSRKANHTGLVMRPVTEQTEMMARRNLVALQNLLDAGYIEKMGAGDNTRFRVLVYCSCSEEIPITRPRPPRVPRPRSTTILAREVFLKLTQGLGHPYQHNWPALAAHLKRWGYDPDFIEAMMVEFAQHPEWCRNAKAPWRAFVTHRYDLVDLVLAATD